MFPWRRVAGSGSQGTKETVVAQRRPIARVIGGPEARPGGLQLKQRVPGRSQRTTVSSLASELKADGVIDYQRGRIEIRDRDVLEALACECYETVRLRQGRAQF